MQFNKKLEIFCFSSRMCINEENSSFISKNVEIIVIMKIKELFPNKVSSLESRFKYLGYFIKPNKYSRDD